ncbi:unnamed protein product [marine sediment metagenome]|uniref:Uncharacterized protein n=1 Tax=marine sediment metagenome TaxID=412755 RepID=X1MMS2_9ZZZZ
MGQRMRDEPIVYGDDCAAGWPPDKTPKYVYARFALIEKCPDPNLIPPNDRTFKLTQEELIARLKKKVRTSVRPGPHFGQFNTLQNPSYELFRVRSR